MSGIQRYTFKIKISWLICVLKVSGDWRKKLESQRGAVLATEIKNNNCKLARWTTQAVMAGAKGLCSIIQNKIK